MSLICSSYFRFIDLKKIIAFSSIIHLNTSLISISSLNNITLLIYFIFSLAHSLSSCLLFILIGFIIDKSYSRFIDSFYFINIILNWLLFFSILININFPGSINFITELLSLISIISIVYFINLFILLFSFLESFIWFIIFNRKIPFHSCFSLYFIHFFLSLFIIKLSYFLGLFVIFIK